MKSNKFYLLRGNGRQDAQQDFVKKLVSLGCDVMTKKFGRRVYVNLPPNWLGDEAEDFIYYVRGDFVVSPGLGSKSDKIEWEYYFEFD